MRRKLSMERPSTESNGLVSQKNNLHGRELPISSMSKVWSKNLKMKIQDFNHQKGSKHLGTTPRDMSLRKFKKILRMWQVVQLPMRKKKVQCNLHDHHNVWKIGKERINFNTRQKVVIFSKYRSQENWKVKNTQKIWELRWASSCLSKRFQKSTANQQWLVWWWWRVRRESQIIFQTSKICYQVKKVEESNEVTKEECWKQKVEEATRKENWREIFKNNQHQSFGAVE